MNQVAKPQSHWTTGVQLGLWLMIAVFLAMGVWRPLGIWPSWIVVMIAVAGFVLFAGRGIKGVWLGAFIDERNKISLSRLQMLAWTIITLSAYGTIVIARIAENPVIAMDVVIPKALWFLMGISTTSLVGSPLVRSIKRAKSAALMESEADELLAEQGKNPGSVRMEGQVVSNRSAEDAEWGDMFRGEEVSNVTQLDLAKIQMFLFTFLMALAYSIAIGSMLRGLTDGAVPSELPEVGNGMLVLLGISNTGYLANKAVPRARSQQNGR